MGSREEHNYEIKLAFKTNNNKADYKALLAKLSVAKMLGEMEIEVKADSQVAVH